MNVIIFLAIQISSRHYTALFMPLSALLFFGSVKGTEAATQTIQLKQGGNYIGFTLSPADAAPSAVFGNLGDAFVQVSTIDNASKKWTFYRNRSKFSSTTDVDLSNAIDPMPNIVMGRGYYVEMTSAATLTVSGTSPTNIQPITLYPGQNFVCPVIPGLTSPIGLSDLLNGPDYQLNSAHLLNGAVHVQFTNNNTSDDTAFSIQPGEALFIESTSSTPITFTPALQQQPLVYFDRSDPLVLESPIAGAGGTSIVNVPVKFTRSYTGPIKFAVSGTAHEGPLADFTFPTVTTTDNVGQFLVSAATSTYSLPITIVQKPKLQTNASMILTLRRPEEAGITDSASLPQVIQVTITDGMKGVYEGVLKTQTGNPTIEGQSFRVALRVSGVAIFEPSDGGMVSSRFTFPYAVDDAGVPQFTGLVSTNLATQNALSRTVVMKLVPGASVALSTNPGDPPAFRLPVTLTLTNLVGSGPIQITASLTLTQANAAY